MKLNKVFFFSSSIYTVPTALGFSQEVVQIMVDVFYQRFKNLKIATFYVFYVVLHFWNVFYIYGCRNLLLVISGALIFLANCKTEADRCF